VITVLYFVYAQSEAITDSSS